MKYQETKSSTMNCYKFFTLLVLIYSCNNPSENIANNKPHQSIKNEGTTNKEISTSNTSSVVLPKVVETAIVQQLKIGSAFIYPIIILQDKSAEKKINQYLMSTYDADANSLEKIKSFFNKKMKEIDTDEADLLSSEYNLNMNGAGLLSINLINVTNSMKRDEEWKQYNFDLTTGNFFDLNQILKPNFSEKIKEKMLPKLKKRLIESLVDIRKENGGIYNKDFSEELSFFEYEFNLKEFNLKKDGLVFIYESSPYSIAEREYWPSPEYFFTWQELGNLLQSNSPITSLYN